MIRPHYPRAMTPSTARIARWTSVVVLGIAAFAVVAFGQSPWWLAVIVLLVIILSFVFGRFEAAGDEDSRGSA